MTKKKKISATSHDDIIEALVNTLDQDAILFCKMLEEYANKHDISKITFKRRKDGSVCTEIKSSKGIEW